MPTNPPLLPVANPSKSYWRSELHPLDDYRSSDELPTHCDIAIIGAGMSGVSVAYHILQTCVDKPKPSIVLLDARSLCSGATGRNGGHVKTKVQTVLAIKEKHGLANAEALVAFVSDQIYAIKDTVEREGLDCEFEMRRSFDIFLDSDETASVKAKFSECAQRGEKWTRDFSMLPNAHIDEVTSIDNTKAAFSGPACSLWPYKFVTQLASRIEKQINIQMQTPVTQVVDDQDAGMQLLKTPRGNLMAKKVVFATNAYTAGILPICQDKIVPYRGHASHLSPDLHFEAPHLSNTYNITYGPQGTDYLNPRPDGGIVVGGAKWTYDDDEKNWYNVWDDSTVLAQPRDHFNTLMQRHFRGWKSSGSKLDSLWSGIMGLTPDEFPYIGAVPNTGGRQYIIAGFNGGGMPLIFLSAGGLAKIITDDTPFSKSGIPSMFEATADRLK